MQQGRVVEFGGKGTRFKAMNLHRLSGGTGRGSGDGLPAAERLQERRKRTELGESAENRMKQRHWLLQQAERNRQGRVQCIFRP